MGFARDEIDERLAAQCVRHPPCSGLVDRHEGRRDVDLAIDAETDGAGERLQGVVAAVGIARIVGLAHAAHQRADVAAIGERGGVGEEQQVAAGNECARQARRSHLDGGLTRETRLADLSKRRQREHVVIAETCRPRRICRTQSSDDLSALIELDAVTLAVVEPDRFDVLEAIERRGETHGRVLTA